MYLFLYGAFVGRRVKQAVRKRGTMKIIVRGKALPQERPRFFRRGNFVGAYDPGKSKDWKLDIKVQALNRGATIQAGALFLRVDFYILRPASVSEKKRPFPNVRPDLDNYIKAVKDALNGVCWKDDGQIVQLISTKAYTIADPRVEIEILPAVNNQMMFYPGEVFDVADAPIVSVGKVFVDGRAF